jgi:LysM repeat protein
VRMTVRRRMTSSAADNPPAPALLPACAPRTDWNATYTVVSGDTLASIARRAGTNFRTLADGNCLADPNAIEVGQVLRLPGAILPASGPFIELGDLTVDYETRQILVNGRGGSLFEGNVIVEVFDSNSNLILQQPTTLNINEVGGSGPWSTTIGADSLTTNGNGTLRAYSTSPRDGSVVASDSQTISFDMRANSSDTITPRIDIQSVSINEGTATLVANGTGSNLFEGNVVVAVWDSASMNLLQQPTTLDAANIASNGPWSITIDVDGLTTNGQGTLYARNISPRDGSILASDSAPVEFDFRQNAESEIDIRWSPWDRMITPNDQGTFPVSGYVTDGAGVQVRVAIMNTGAQVVAQRTVTTDSTGNWYIGDMSINTASVGTHTITATLVDGGAADSQRVIVTERPAAASQSFTNGSYTIVYPQGWYAIGDAGSVGYATHPANDFPPGAAMGPYTQLINAGTQPYDDGRTVDSIVQNILAQASDGTRESVTLADGTPGVLLRYTGGTGKQLYSLVVDSGQDFIIAGGQGRGDVVVPLLLRMSVNAD